MNGEIHSGDGQELRAIEKILREKVNPCLEKHGGGVVPVSYERGIFCFRLTGGCAGCPAADDTIEHIVKRELQAAMPEIKEVVLESQVSEELYRLARSLLTSRGK